MTAIRQLAVGFSPMNGRHQHRRSVPRRKGPAFSLARAACGRMALFFRAEAGAQRGPVDLSGFWTVKFEAEPGGQVLIDKLPSSAVLIDDTGAGELGQNDFGGLVLTPAAPEDAEAYDFATEHSRENARTIPSAAFFMQAPFPMEIYHGEDMIVFRMEYYDMHRIVFLDGREHPPEDAPHTKSGHSIGRWQGDTLIVDTTHMSSATFMNNGFSHSDDIHMIERFRLSPDGNTLWLTQLCEDSAVFERLAARYMAWTRRPGEFTYPYECHPGYGD